MKKILILVLVPALIAAGCFGIMYFSRDWHEVEQFTAYHYDAKEDNADNSNPSISREGKDSVEQRLTDNSFPPSFLKEYFGYAYIAEIDHSWNYPKWKIQCNNMLIKGSVSLFLYDNNGNILFQKKQIESKTDSFEEELDSDIHQRAYYIMILPEEDTVGQYEVTFLGR